VTRAASLLLLLLAAAGCHTPPSAVAAPAAPAAQPAATLAPVCTSPEHRQFDFWIGDWDLVIHARTSPEADEWADARATQHIEAILSGCAISEDFVAEGPGQPWAGRSYSSWQPKLGKWRQTWVDDSGGYIALIGGVENGVMTLYGEPFERNGQTVRMRMVFLDVTADALRWEWQSSSDDGASWKPMIVIDYRRRAA
jgi:hypothetical protein